MFTLVNEEQDGGYFTETQVYFPETGTVVLNGLYHLFPAHGMGPYDLKDWPRERMVLV